MTKPVVDKARAAQARAKEKARNAIGRVIGLLSNSCIGYPAHWHALNQGHQEEIMAVQRTLRSIASSLDLDARELRNEERGGLI
jgi:hypothetical protein